MLLIQFRSKSDKNDALYVKTYKNVYYYFFQLFVSWKKFQQSWRENQNTYFMYSVFSSKNIIPFNETIMKRKRQVRTVCEYFRRSAEVVISRMRAVFPHSSASHGRQYEKIR